MKWISYVYTYVPTFLDLSPHVYPTHLLPFITGHWAELCYLFYTWYLFPLAIYFTHGLFSSVQSNSLWPHGLQHSGPPCPSPTPGVYSNSCPWSRWCHPATSSSVVPFSSCLQSFPASGSFQMSQFFASGGQSIEKSKSKLQWSITSHWAERPSSKIYKQ